ncbi:hypothetical protein RB623_19880 [Mesorhizobium sp. LHD-90]|uniref:hypothetical protein n=1 Tax=Mesorhizobium sp. LHD-90 TaxID=3071414 RepID=UPI0027E049CB|nr:hypothetical protein [Mesorhizobium sp. LHD-90]MDQ6436324.1 hypothetical protein [Mesorhizobium sp. LHD-90]
MKLYERFADKEFHTSIATSFGIDFDAYENIVLPRLRGAGCRNNIVVADSRMLTHALSGASALPRQAGRLYTVTGTSAAGVFHPKLFLQVGRHRGRLIVSSANLTSPGLAGNLELASMIACDGSDSGEQQLIAQAWLYLSRFGSDGQQGLSAQIDWMRERAPWLSKATPAAGPVRLADGTMAALLTAGDTSGIGQRFAQLIDEPVSRLIVISPYWDINLAALSFLAQRLGPTEIALLLDPDTSVFPKDALGRVPGVRLYDRGDFRQGRFIHAKAIVAQTAGADHMLLGSANCTRAALGVDGVAGLNEEACLYRRLPARSVPVTLGLTDFLTSERQIDPAALPDLLLEEDLPLDELAAQNPGKFECRVDTLIWHPSAAYDPAASTILLLDQQGKPIPCRLSPLQVTDAFRYQIGDTEVRPAFARVLIRGGRLSAPSIVTLIDRLRTAVRETSSREAENALRQLDDETEASLLLLDVLNILERIEQGESASKVPLSIPKTGKSKEATAPEYRKLTYEDFIADRRPRTGTHLTHSSLAGSDVSIVRNVLNRIVGLAADDVDDDDEKVPGGAFDMGDETADAQAALNAGEEFDTEKTRRDEEKRAKTRRRKAAEAMKATKAQIVIATASFRERIRKRKENGALDNHDIFRLRALLMIICTAGWPGAAGKSGKPPLQSRLQVLPAEGDQDSWPVVLGRALFEIFGGNHPAIRHLYLSGEHDQIPGDIVECWATCYWCLQACLTAPLSPRERKRITQYLKPVAELAYRLTLPTKEELLGDDVMSVMEAMSTSYGDRLGIEPAEIVNSHRALVKTLFRDGAQASAAL